MEDQLDILFQHWNKLDSKVLVSEIKPTKEIGIENLIAETTKYCRYSGRLTWILIDWLIRNIHKIDTEKLIHITKEIGDISVLGLVSDIAKQKRNDLKFEYIIKSSKPNDRKEIFFYRIAKSKLASRIAVEETLPIYDKWNFYGNELRYITTESEFAETMTGQIKQELHRLELEHDIKILYAVESGSRAWGFASPDSDWDVRYIYIHRLDWYLKIDEQKDNREEILPNGIDLAGWELKKALRLFRKSNPPLLEWLRSPIVYLEQGSTAGRLRELTEVFFNPKSCLHHYLHMAEGNYRQYLQKDSVRVKKYFYVLRPILACDWIKETNAMAPMEFHKLLDRQVKDPKVKNEIQNLLSRKMTGDELNEAPKIQILNDFLGEKINFYNDYVQSLERDGRPDTALLDALFEETIYETWG